MHEREINILLTCTYDEDRIEALETLTTSYDESLAYLIDHFFLDICTPLELRFIMLATQTPSATEVFLKNRNRLEKLILFAKTHKNEVAAILVNIIKNCKHCLETVKFRKNAFNYFDRLSTANTEFEVEVCVKRTELLRRMDVVELAIELVKVDSNELPLMLLVDPYFRATLVLEGIFDLTANKNIIDSCLRENLMNQRIFMEHFRSRNVFSVFMLDRKNKDFVRIQSYYLRNVDLKRVLKNNENRILFLLFCGDNGLNEVDKFNNKIQGYYGSNSKEKLNKIQRMAFNNGELNNKELNNNELNNNKNNKETNINELNNNMNNKELNSVQIKENSRIDIQKNLELFNAQNVNLVAKKEEPLSIKSIENYIKLNANVEYILKNLEFLLLLDEYVKYYILEVENYIVATLNYIHHRKYVKYEFSCTPLYIVYCIVCKVEQQRHINSIFNDSSLPMLIRSISVLYLIEQNVNIYCHSEYLFYLLRCFVFEEWMPESISILLLNLINKYLSKNTGSNESVFNIATTQINENNGLNVNKEIYKGVDKERNESLFKELDSSLTINNNLNIVESLNEDLKINTESNIHLNTNKNLAESSLIGKVDSKIKEAINNTKKLRDFTVTNLKFFSKKSDDDESFEL